MSTDHSATTDSEKYRLRNEHPMDSDIIVEQYDEWKEDYDCVVKSVTRFTRSIGDAHMKDKTCAKLFNSYRCGVSIDPVPRKIPYISSKAEVQEREIDHGFLIIACDGIWDEMSSDEAVHLCSHLMTTHDGVPEANIADLFLNETLKKATARLRRTDPDEGELTLEELKARPLGKQGRSQLHDDLTCVIISFRSTAAKLRQFAAGGGGWKSIKKAVDMHTEIKHRKKLKWARLMDDMMVMVRQEREGQPSTLTTQILSEADGEDDEDEDGEEGEADKAAALKLIGDGGVDFTRAVASAAQAAEAAAKAATSADLVGRTGDPEVMRACAMAANAAAAAANQATAAAGAAAAAATSAALACEAMARACGVDITAATGAEQEAKD
jgi:serine/threonine protein phosphatase PrpC